jgi:transcriptional regulator with XRE-family HTH domain
MGRTSLSDIARAERNVSIAGYHLSGKTQRQLAKIHHVSPTQISRLLASNETIKDIVEAATLAKVAALPKAVEVQINTLFSRNEDRAYKASIDLQNHTGVGTQPVDRIPQNIRDIIIKKANVAIFTDSPTLQAFKDFIKTPLQISEVPEAEIIDEAK